MKTPVLIISALGLLLLKGCANIISGSNEPAMFNSIPSGIEFNIKNEDHTIIYHSITPVTITLERGNSYLDGQTYNVDFIAPNYLLKNKIADTKMNGGYMSNLMFGGFVGLLAVDPAT